MTTNIITGMFRRLSPLLKARTVLRRSVSAPACSVPNMTGIADVLALGWVEEQIAIQRDGLTFLTRAEKGLDRAIAAAGRMCDQVGAGTEESLRFFTLLENIRGDVRLALERMTLTAVACAFAFAVLTHHPELKRRAGSSKNLRRRTETVWVPEGETS